MILPTLSESPIYLVLNYTNCARKRFDIRLLRKQDLGSSNGKTNHKGHKAKRFSKRYCI